VAVWDQFDGVRSNLWSNRYTPSAGWGMAVLIETNDTVSAFFPQVAIDPSGNAVTVWQQDDGTSYSVRANRYTPSAGWGMAVLIEIDDTGSAGRPQVAVDPSGNAVAVWEHYDGSSRSIWSNRYTPSAGWGTAVLIETDDTSSSNNHPTQWHYPQVAVDPNGNATAVWRQSDGTRFDIWSNRFE